MIGKEHGFVYEFLQGINTRPLYVGSTTDPVSRFRAHFMGNRNLSAQQLDTVKFIRIAYAGNEEACRMIEAALIYSLMPAYNSQQPIAHYITVDHASLPWFTFTKDAFLKDQSIVFGCFETYWRGRLSDDAQVDLFPEQKDDWEELIRPYVEDKYRVCIKEVWYEAIKKNAHPCLPPTIAECRRIGKILTQSLGFSRGNQSRFKKYGPQKQYFSTRCTNGG